MATVRLQTIGNVIMATVRSSSSSCHDHPQHLTQPRPEQQAAGGGRGEGGRTTFLLCIAHEALSNTPIHDSTTAGGEFLLSYLGVPS